MNELFDVAAIKARGMSLLKAEAEAVRTRLLEPLSDWSHPPEFTITVADNGGMLSATIETADPIFAYHDNGTAPYTIHAKPGGVLAFDTGRQNVTKGYVSQRVRGGGGLAFAKSVHHPGLHAQNWTEGAAKEAELHLQESIGDIL